jgi:hypothetical protein
MTKLHSGQRLTDIEDTLVVGIIPQLQIRVFAYYFAEFRACSKRDARL